MNGPPSCPSCATPAVAGDRFCEVCGAHLRRRPPDVADHVEIVVEGAAAISDRGRVRARNEDAVAAGRADPAGPVAAVVCDGVSSTRSSERAARAAAGAALDVLLHARPGSPGRETGGDVDPAASPAGQASGDVRRAVATAAAAAAALVPPGTPSPPSSTLVCGVHDVSGGVVTVGWVGDSRAYWLAEPGATEPARLLSADHTAQAAAAAGALDPAVAATRPDAITRWLGADGDGEPDIVSFAPAGPGVLLLCSDGLWRYLPTAAALAAVVLPALARGGGQAAAAALTAAALSAGGADNVTVAVLPVHSP